jgi:hypothetical protein
MPTPRPRETEIVAEVPEPLEELSTRAWLRERVDARVATAVGASWFLVSAIVFALEPATDESEPLLGVLLGVAWTALFFAMLAGLAMRRRWGLVASAGASIVFTAFTIECPLSGHHQFGLWWYGQMACALALVVISFAALLRGIGRADA